MIRATNLKKKASLINNFVLQLGVWAWVGDDGS